MKVLAETVQIDVVREGRLRVIDEDVEFALEKVIPGESWEIDEIEDFTGVGYVVRHVNEQGDWEPFKITSKQLATLKTQLEADTGATVTVEAYS